MTMPPDHGAWRPSCPRADVRLARGKLAGMTRDERVTWALLAALVALFVVVTVRGLGWL